MHFTVFTEVDFLSFLYHPLSTSESPYLVPFLGPRAKAAGPRL